MSHHSFHDEIDFSFSFIFLLNFIVFYFEGRLKGRRDGEMNGREMHDVKDITEYEPLLNNHKLQSLFCKSWKHHTEAI